MCSVKREIFFLERVQILEYVDSRFLFAAGGGTDSLTWFMEELSRVMRLRLPGNREIIITTYELLAVGLTTIAIRSRNVLCRLSLSVRMLFVFSAAFLLLFSSFFLALRLLWNKQWHARNLSYHNHTYNKNRRHWGSKMMEQNRQWDHWVETWAGCCACGLRHWGVQQNC